MIASLGTGVTQTDEEFVGAQNESGKMKRALVCHRHAADNIRASLKIQVCKQRSMATKVGFLEVPLI